MTTRWTPEIPVTARVMVAVLREDTAIDFRVRRGLPQIMADAIARRVGNAAESRIERLEHLLAEAWNRFVDEAELYVDDWGAEQ